MGSGTSKPRPEVKPTIDDPSAIQEARRKDADLLEHFQRLQAENSQLRLASTDLEGAIIRMRAEVLSTNIDPNGGMVRMRDQLQTGSHNASDLQEQIQGPLSENCPVDSTNSNPVMASMQDEIQHLKAEISRLLSEIEGLQNPKAAGLAETNKRLQSNTDTQAETGMLLKQKLEEQVKSGFRRRDNVRLREVFDKLSVEIKVDDTICKGLSKEKVFPALEEMGTYISRADYTSAESFLKFMDSNSNGVIEFEEFKAAAQTPSPLSQWARSLPFAEIFADAVPKQDPDKDPLRMISRLSREERDAVSEAFGRGVRDMLDIESDKLSRAFGILDEKKAREEANAAAAKYQVYAMSCGRVDDYHKGLTSRVGHPHLKFMEAMRAEHCSRAGCDHEFETSNYKIKTTPRREWQITVEFDLADLTEADKAFKRRFLKIEDHMQCKLVLDCKLSECEVSAVVLYTGPMFMVFNCVLRRWPEALFNVFSEGGNNFPTTINVLVSAVQTVSRSVKLPERLPLHRGLGGSLELPEQFHKPDEQGRRGFVEWGFMSMTSKKETAIEYSGVKEDKPQPMMLEAQSGALARGACIQDLSQYPQEVEFLLPPCSLVEPCGAARLEVTEVGVLKVMPVSIMPNVKTLTLEEHLQQKKSMHLATFEFLLTQLGPEIQATAEQDGFTERITQNWPGESDEYYVHCRKEFLNKIGEQGHEFFVKQKGRAVDDFTDDDKYRGMVGEMLKVKTMAMAKLQLYIGDVRVNNYVVRDMSLGEAYRRLVALLRGREGEGNAKAAQQLCRLEGLEYEEVNELSEPPLVSVVREHLPLVHKLKLLVAAGADLDAGDSKGLTALHAAVDYDYADAVAALIDLKADINAWEKEEDGEEELQ